MLPFQRDKKTSVAGLIIKNRAPDVKPEDQQQEDDPAAAIDACSKSLIDAIHARDIKAASQAIKDAFDILESMPHDEVDHSYDAQNEKAAQDNE